MGGSSRREPDRPFGPTLLDWTIKADGTVIADSGTPTLPTEYRNVTGPQTVTIDGTELRIAGAPAGGPGRGDYVVVAQTLDAVGEAQTTVLRAELIIGPILLLVVFLGAIAIGRRVAAPIERARQRQLEFTADASHELRTPLAVIEANTSLALAADRSADWYRAAFGRIDGESQRMRRLVEDLLWLARFDAAQAPPSAEPVDLGILAERTADRFAAVAETRRLRISVHADPDVVVGAPPDWIDRLVGVLLDNACKYSPEGGAVDVTVVAAGGRARLTVDDAGPGIPEEERELIFDRFHRATEKESGAGLGLAIADAVVRATGGRWQVAASSGGRRAHVRQLAVAAAGRPRIGAERVTLSTGTASETAVHGPLDLPPPGPSPIPASPPPDGPRVRLPLPDPGVSSAGAGVGPTPRLRPSGRIRRPLREALTFCAIGVVSTLAYAVLYALLRGAVAAPAANAIALVVTAVGNTAANRRLTFGVRGARVDAPGPGRRARRVRHRAPPHVRVDRGPRHRGSGRRARRGARRPRRRERGGDHHALRAPPHVDRPSRRADPYRPAELERTIR